MKHQSVPAIYHVLFREGEPVHPRIELGETLPHHADMLRYDLGFHSPTDTALVVFPWFRHKSDGAYPENLTVARWKSFGLKLEEVKEVSLLDEGDWIGYWHPTDETGRTDYTQLAPISLYQWLRLHPKVRIAGWKTLGEVNSRYWAVTGR